MNFFEQQEKKLIKAQLVYWKDINTLPKVNGVYYIYKKGTICYIGESKNIWDRFFKHHRIGNCSTFINNLVKEYNGDKFEVQSYLKDCYIKYIELEYGRKELEEYLLNKYKPKYNNVGRNREGSFYGNKTKNKRKV